MACGWWFRLNASQTTHQIYLLLGIPLVILFQLAVARRPLRRLWVRESSAFRLDRTGGVLAVVLISLPAVLTLMSRRSPVMTASFLCSVIGAVPAAFALRRQSAHGLRRALGVFGAAVVIGAGIFAAFAVRDGRSLLFSFDKLPLLAAQTWAMFTAGFVVEEVVFRGALDSHLAPGGSTGNSRHWQSAVFVSALWGLWHLPLDHITGLRSLGGCATEELCQHIAVGVPLSFCWRRSGTLVLPAAAHALIDAYRNVIASG
jgi:membrane protease YdiL (CAAX protease family)